MKVIWNDGYFIIRWIPRSDDVWRKCWIGDLAEIGKIYSRAIVFSIAGWYFIAKGVPMAERIDWTKLLVPRRTDNQTDFVTLLSVEEFIAESNLCRNKKVTDYAMANGCDLAKDGCYWLRDTGAIVDSGDITYGMAVDTTQIGLAPSISLRLPSNYTVAQVMGRLGMIKQTTADGVDYYQVNLGEYPKTRIPYTSSLFYQLRERFNSTKPENNFGCTGRLFTSVVREFNGWTNKYGKIHYPEFTYQDEKYVRTSHGDWFKVEPIIWLVKNFDEIARGRATQIDLDCTEVIVGEIPFQPDQNRVGAEEWQNSLVRIFLNGAKDSNHWDFTQDGFLQEALNMTREPTREYTIPATENRIASNAFAGCRGLEKIFIPKHVADFGKHPFMNCENLQFYLSVDHCFDDLYDFTTSVDCRHFYVPRSLHGKWFVNSPYVDHRLDQDYRCIDCRGSYNHVSMLFGDNFRKNFIQLSQWKDNGKIKFIPPEFTMKIFPASEMANYFVNNNHKRWAELVKMVRFNLLEDRQKVNALTDLMKIYYALGGFSQHKGARDQAFDYVMQHVATLEHQGENDLSEVCHDETESSLPLSVWRLSDEIHQRFAQLKLKGPYQPTFAKFFMKYYHKNRDFMKFDFVNQDEQDYLCAAHNSFDQILKNYPNRVVNGNTARDLLTPEFVARHCMVIDYMNVDVDNQALAETLGRYSYPQAQFDKIQTIYNQAKKIKSRSVIRANQTAAEYGISFRVLEKDDPLGFVLGNITNCCQQIGSIGESCVIDGYVNPNAGFLVFEESLQDANGKPTGNKRILGQAYVWYDPQTRTVCYDNIEIPDKTLQALKQKAVSQKQFSIDALMQIIVNSADAMMTTMNQNGTKVKRVTVGKGYNNLQFELDANFMLTDDLAKHRDYHGYTDAHEQYVIRTYDQTLAQIKTQMSADQKQDNARTM